MHLLLLLVLASSAASSASCHSFTDYSDDIRESSADLSPDEESRLIGGTDIDLDKFPYVAICVATLIAPRYLLTTAHCIKTNEADMMASFATEYSFGNDGELVSIVQGYKHPRYNKRHTINIFFFIKIRLEKPVRPKLATLPSPDGSNEEVGTMATVLGWAPIKKSTFTFKLQHATVPIISHDQCSKFRLYKHRLTKGMLCAGDGKGKGSCRGDAGGPLIVDDVLIGFVSWAGDKCGQEPGVYSRVSSVLDYIEDIVNGGDGQRFAPSTEL
ncbi:hypothetical protein PsorP6_015337 [Peronosclerospora sorghi]|uniref:Uncharacterized protein n=1 Tax=Peronosclerospora sorghi TaxID=230839 RepID=A0ACC0VRD5_9STRA|nr:hypothetical protein PsorP6_015337 [Peronosclerospora sorghi]